MQMFVLQVRTGCEFLIAHDIRRAGYLAYAPERVALHRRGGAVWRQQRIVFSGYVFVEMEMSPHSYHKIMETPGVIRFLGFGVPEPLRDQEQKYIKWLYNDGDIIEPSEVRINAAGEMQPIAGMLCKLWPNITKHNQRQNRATVRIPIAGKDYYITLACEYKSPACSV